MFGQVNRNCGKIWKDLIRSCHCFTETWDRKQISNPTLQQLRQLSTTQFIQWKCHMELVGLSSGPDPVKHSSRRKWSGLRISTPQVSLIFSTIQHSSCSDLQPCFFLTNPLCLTSCHDQMRTRLRIMRPKLNVWLRLVKCRAQLMIWMMMTLIMSRSLRLVLIRATDKKLREK